VRPHNRFDHRLAGPVERLAPSRGVITQNGNQGFVRFMSHASNTPGSYIPTRRADQGGTMGMKMEDRAAQATLALLKLAK